MCELWAHGCSQAPVKTRSQICSPLPPPCSRGPGAPISLVKPSEDSATPAPTLSNVEVQSLDPQPVLLQVSCVAPNGIPTAALPTLSPLMEATPLAARACPGLCSPWNSWLCRQLPSPPGPAAPSAHPGSLRSTLSDSSSLGRATSLQQG